MGISNSHPFELVNALQLPAMIVGNAPFRCSFRICSYVFCVDWECKMVFESFVRVQDTSLTKFPEK